MFVDCNWVDTRWQQYGTHLHTDSTQNDTNICPIFASFTLAFALPLRKKHGKTSFRVAEDCERHLKIGRLVKQSGSQDSAVNTGTRLRAGRPVFESRPMSSYFSLLQDIQTRYGNIPNCYSIGTGSFHGNYRSCGLKFTNYSHLVPT